MFVASTSCLILACSVRSHAASIIKQPANNCSLRSPLHRSVTSFLCDSVLRCFASLMKKIIKQSKSRYYLQAPPDSSGRSASVREVECWSTLVDQPRNASNTSSVFRCMLLKQTPVCCNSFQFADNACVLEITIRHPDFNNTEILLRRNSYPIYMRNDI